MSTFVNLNNQTYYSPDRVKVISKLIIARFRLFVRSSVRPSVRHTVAEKAEERRRKQEVAS